MGQYSQFCRLVPHFHEFLSSAHMTLTMQSVRSVGFGMLIEQILYLANFMLIGPQEKASFLSAETVWVGVSGASHQPPNVVGWCGIADATNTYPKQS